MTKPLALNRAAALALMALTPAPSLAGTAALGCDDPVAATSRICSDLAVQGGDGPGGWLACDGRCALRQEGSDALLLDRKGKTLRRLPDLQFLAGGGMTSCLTSLPFLDAKGQLVLLSEAGEEAGPSRPLAPLYPETSMEEPVIRAALTERARLSCDGKRFFAPLSDGEGGMIERLTAQGFSRDTPEDAATLILSPSGRYGLETSAEGTYRLRDYTTGASFQTDARQDLDLAFFDLDETHLLIRRAAPDPALPGQKIEIVDLASGASLGEAEQDPDGGLDVLVRRAGDRLTLIPLIP